MRADDGAGPAETQAAAVADNARHGGVDSCINDDDYADLDQSLPRVRHRKLSRTEGCG